VSSMEEIPVNAYLNISSGNLSEHSEDELSYKLTVAQTQFMVLAMAGRNSKIFDVHFGNGELKQLVHHLDVYFKYHIEGYQERKSDSIFEQMLLI